jgi:hypothetical protein
MRSIPQISDIPLYVIILVGTELRVIHPDIRTGTGIKEYIGTDSHNIILS